MPDICDLILDDHEYFRRRFAELDELSSGDGPAPRLTAVWGPLSAELDLHAAAEEQIFYPELLASAQRAVEETKDAVSDHNEIRDGVRRAEGLEVGSDGWWEAVNATRDANSDHMAEEERGAIADFRRSVETSTREALGARWLAFAAEHPGGRDVDRRDRDPDRYIAEHR